MDPLLQRLSELASVAANGIVCGDVELESLTRRHINAGHGPLLIQGTVTVF
jgi:hypothetical protein